MAGSDFWSGLVSGFQPHLQSYFAHQDQKEQQRNAYEAQLIQILAGAEDPNLRTLAVAAQMEKAGKRGRHGKGILSGMKLEDLFTGAYQQHPAFQKLAPVAKQLEAQAAGGAGEATGRGEHAGPPENAIVGAPPPASAPPPQPSSQPSSQPDNAFLSVLAANAQPALPLAQFAGQPQLSPRVAQGSTLGAPPGAQPGAPPPASASAPPAASTVPPAIPPAASPARSPVADVEAMGFSRDVLGGFGPMGRHAFATTLAGQVSEKERFRAEEATKRQVAAEGARRQAAVDKFERDQRGRIEAIELKATHAMERKVYEAGAALERKKLGKGAAKPSGITERDRQLRVLALGKDERDDILKLETERDKELRGIDRDRSVLDVDRAALKATAEQAWNAKISQTRKLYADALGDLQGMSLGGALGGALGGPPPGGSSAGAGEPAPGTHVGETRVFPSGRQGWWDGQIWRPTPPWSWRPETLGGVGAGVGGVGAPPP